MVRGSPGRVGVSGPEGVDTLVDIERVQFTDRSLAFDLDGAAGSAARLICTLLGRGNLTPAIAGAGIAAFDSGATMLQVAEAALAVPMVQQLEGGRTHADLVRLIYTNLVGSAPSSVELAGYAGLLDNGSYTPAGLVALAAESTFAANRIDLAGLAATGLGFIPG